MVVAHQAQARAPEVAAEAADSTAAVAKVGLDRKAIRDYVANTTHKTIIGDFKFNGSENVGTPGTVSQWQNGEFEVVWPQKIATAKLNAAKPAWK